MCSHSCPANLQNHDILSADAISEYTSVPKVSIRVARCTASTNTDAKLWAAQGAPHGSVLAAESQNGGRGRLGRAFSSPPGGIYLSIILRPSITPEQGALVTAAAAVAVCSAVDQLCGIDLGIKWVNDLFLDGRKCCGILTEAGIGLEPGKVEYIVAGIGLNFAVPVFTEELRDTAASLYPKAAPPVTRAQLIGQIYKNFMLFADKLPDDGFMDEYISRSILFGKQVMVCETPPYPATVMGIDRAAHLVVRKQDGEITKLFAGEVSIKI